MLISHGIAAVVRDFRGELTDLLENLLMITIYNVKKLATTGLKKPHKNNRELSNIER